MVHGEKKKINLSVMLSLQSLLSHTSKSYQLQQGPRPPEPTDFASFREPGSPEWGERKHRRVKPSEIPRGQDAPWTQWFDDDDDGSWSHIGVFKECSFYILRTLLTEVEFASEQRKAAKAAEDKPVSDVDLQSRHNRELFHDMLSWIEKGKSVRSFCQQPGMPSRKSLDSWRKSDPELAAKYLESREIGFAELADETVGFGFAELADETV